MIVLSGFNTGARWMSVSVKATHSTVLYWEKSSGVRIWTHQAATSSVGRRA
jgi:hypothetical protein